MQIWVVCLLVLTFLPSFAAALQINEIMYDPAASESYAEWIELYNNESEDINLTDWFLCGDEILSGYVNKSDGLTNYTNNMTLASGDYAIITDGGTGSTVLNNFTVSPTAILFHVNSNEMCTNGLKNTGETVTLNRTNGTIYDSISYTDITSQNYSIERSSDEILLYESSALGGTPGYANSQPQSLYNLTVNAFPTSLAFSAQSFVNVTFRAGNYNFTKIRIIAYAYSPKYIAVDNAGSKISQQFYSADTAKEFLDVNVTNTTTNLTFNLESNCNSADPTGTYTGRVRVYNLTNASSNVWQEIQTADFTFSVTANQNCPPPSSPPPSSGSSGGSTLPPSPSISIDIISYKQSGEDFEISASIFNQFNSAKDVEVYSYIYRDKYIASEGGWTPNKKGLTLKPNSKTSVKLKNTIKPDAEGEFTLKVRVKDGNDKTYDGTEKIKLEKLPEESRDGKVTVNVSNNKTNKNSGTGPTGFFIKPVGNNTNGISGAILSDVSNYVSIIINGIANLVKNIFNMIF